MQGVSRTGLDAQEIEIQLRKRRAQSQGRTTYSTSTSSKADYEKFMMTVYQTVGKKKVSHDMDFQSRQQQQPPAHHNFNTTSGKHSNANSKLNNDNAHNNSCNQQSTSESGMEAALPRLTMMTATNFNKEEPASSQNMVSQMRSSNHNAKLDLEAELENAILSTTRGFPNAKYKALKSFLNSYQEMKKKTQKESMKMLGLEVRKLDYAPKKSSMHPEVEGMRCAKHLRSYNKNCADCNNQLLIEQSGVKLLGYSAYVRQGVQQHGDMAVTLNARAPSAKNNSAVIECRGYSTRRVLASTALRDKEFLDSRPTTAEQELLLVPEEAGLLTEHKMTSMGGSCSATLRNTGNSHGSTKYIYFHQKLANKKFKFSMGDNTNTVYQTKMRSYRDFLFKIHFAHNVYLDMFKKDEEPNFVMRTEQKYRAWIGPGNNNLLVKSLIKRRFWWHIVDQRDSNVQFYWTQLKLGDVFKKQCPSKTQQLLADILKSKEQVKCNQQDDEGDSIDQPRGSARKKKTSYTKKTSVAIPRNREASPQIKKIKRPQSMTKKPSKKTEDVLDKVFSPSDQELMQTYTQLYEAKQPQPITHKKANLRKTLIQQVVQPTSSTVVHNHLENNFFLGNKKAMFYNLKQYYQLKGSNVFQYVPLTFHIRNGLKCPQYKKFLQYYKKRATTIKHQEKLQQDGQRIAKHRKMRNIWIVKPGQLSNRGNGITVIDEVYELNKIIGKKQTHANGSTKTYIVQLYIDRPLLYNRRKFDIRHYMLITNTFGVQRGYWYSDGYIRTASYEFDIDNFQREIHLTNDAVQKYTDAYGRYEAANKLSYTEFQRYLDCTYPNKHYNFAEQILPKMKQIGSDAVRSAYLKIAPNNLEHNFEIFGLDFMIDENFRPWLIEINTNPCLELACPLLQRIIPQMVQQSLRLSLDVVFPPPCHYSNTNKHLVPDASLQNLKYRLIFDSLVDGEAMRKLYKDVATSKLMAQIGELSDDQEYADEGFQIKGEDL